jgi:hypothetical protein
MKRDPKYINYKRALEVLAKHDDNDWLQGGDLTAAASIVVDVFRRSQDQVRKDLQKMIVKLGVKQEP